MSRIGRLPVEIEEGVSCKIEDGSLKVKGPKGELERKIPGRIGVRIEGKKIIVSREDEERATKSLHGLTRTLINNMITGVTKGFEKEMLLSGVGWKVGMKDKDLILNVGYSHPVVFSPPKGITIQTDKEKIRVSGIDKELVGEISARIRRIRPVEPYKGKGIRYADEVVRRKAGKTGGGAK
ncbi:MAG: 50S ribosomal protein L6 [bacterium]